MTSWTTCADVSTCSPYRKEHWSSQTLWPERHRGAIGARRMAQSAEPPPPARSVYLLSSRARERVQRRLQIVHRLIVQTEQMVVAVADNPALINHDHRALGAQATRGAVGLGHGLVHVRQQRHREAVFLDESTVGVQVLRRYADDRRVQSRKGLRAIAIRAHLL